MKKVLLISLLFLILTLSAKAYETIIIKYPDGELWQKAYYKKVGLEALLQYVPAGQSASSWKRSIFVHSYNESTLPVNLFIANDLARMTKTNPTNHYKYLKLTDTDAIAGRCTEDYKNVKAQCEFFRVTRTHNGIVTLHYVNRDKKEFIRDFKKWYDIIRKAKYLNSYWRNERMLNKSEYFEL